MAGYSQDQKSKEQRLGALEIGGTETLGEPALDRGKQVAASPRFSWSRHNRASLVAARK
jgi:hypothetical protein